MGKADGEVCHRKVMINIYAPIISDRLRFSCDFIFNTVLNLPYTLFSNLDQINRQTIFINYSSENNSGLKFLPSGLLEENGVKNFKPELINYQNLSLIFFNGKYDFPFDIFSMVFYFISRYEEYQSYTSDEHGRFPAKESFSFINGILNQPVVDKAIWYFGAWLMEKNLTTLTTKPNFTYHSTIDVDNAYYAKGKSLGRVIGASGKAALKTDFKESFRRLSVYLSGKKDPFDQYDFQIRLSKELGIPLTYFILFAHTTDYDRSLAPGNTAMRQLIHFLNLNADVGIHPSYFSSENAVKLRTEILSFGKMVKTLQASRQHFLKFKLPETYLQLLDSGIEFEYSMGYSTHNGFRAGTSYSFNFFDLRNEKTTALKIVPFQLMDSVFYDKFSMSAYESWDEIKNIADQVYETGGTLVSVWHDRAFDDVIYPGWKDCYEKLHRYCRHDTVS